MITTTSPAFYLLKTSGEAAELLTSLISPLAMLDVSTITAVSKTFDNEIEPINEMDDVVFAIRAGLISDVEVVEEFNPLFYPADDSAIDDALGVQLKSDFVSFDAMDGNPFSAKRVQVIANEQPTIQGQVVFKSFDLPGYETIMEARKRPLN